MNVSTIAAMASAHSQATLQQEVSLTVLKKALDMQGEGALQLLEAVPELPVAPVGTAGGVIDTWA
ncbi:MAG: YjfB family protein [Rhodocyclaceae bacterium]